MITFKEHFEGYPARTYENAGADITLAFAYNFNSAGERLTQKYVEERGKIFIRVDPKEIPFERLQTIAELLHITKARTLNIAGNSIYTCLKCNKKLTQGIIDAVTYNILAHILIQDYDYKIESIQSGGQTGFDEAGLKAAILLGIPAICIAPKGWLFQNEKGQHIKDEKLFKSRFDNAIKLKSIL